MFGSVLVGLGHESLPSKTESKISVFNIIKPKLNRNQNGTEILAIWSI